jgi:hypothetical protein
VHRLHHPFEHRIEEPPRFLGVAVGEELHGAFEVGKQHGYLLALAFEGAAGGDNALGEVLGRVSGRGRCADSRRGGRADRVGALHTKLRPGRKLGPAGAALAGERRGALHAELRLGRVLGLALPTLH